MLKILSSLFRSHLSKIADKVNDEVVEGENGNGNTIFASKKSKNAKFKNSIYV